MPAPPTPLDYANAVARNVVPLAGILFLGWSAANVLILYFVVTFERIDLCMKVGLEHCR